jgi:hypothetical protein
MRVLMLESDRHWGDGAVRQLQAAGHTVVRCHEQDQPAFPCNALFDKGLCPLEAPESVDVVVDHRAHAYPRPTENEDGVTCALRHHVPLVASGVTVLSPFEPWITTYADDDDIVHACEEACAAPVELLGRPATAELRRVLGLPIDGDAGRVEVHRDGGHLRAVATVPVDAGEVESKIAVKIAGVLRRLDNHASQIDVAVVREGQ